MSKLALVFLGMAFLCGCGSSSSDSSDGSYSQSCTLIGSYTSIQATLISEEPLPENFAVSLNDSSLMAEECRLGQGFLVSKIHSMSSDRKKANLEFFLNGNDELRNYFADASSGPTSETMDLKLYTSPNCESTPNQYRVVPNVGIAWQPVYANGTHCEVTSYKGSAEVSLR